MEFYKNEDKPYIWRDIIPMKIIKKYKGEMEVKSLTFPGSSMIIFTDEFIKQVSNTIITNLDERKECQDE